jgi:hypothetical protein
MPDPLTTAANWLGLQADWRAAASPQGQGEALPTGQPMSVAENIALAQKLREQFGPQTYEVAAGARGTGPGAEEATKKVEGATGKQGFTQNELASMGRYPAGQDLAQQMGPQLATIMNAIYTAEKAAAQHFGQPQAPSQALGLSSKFDPTTSDASWENLLTAQAGIASQDPRMQAIAPIAQFIWDLLQGKVTGDRGPGARTKGGGSSPPRG